MNRKAFVKNIAKVGVLAVASPTVSQATPATNKFKDFALSKKDFSSWQGIRSFYKFPVEVKR